MLVNSGETAATAEPATIQIEIPASTKEGSQLTYEILDASLSYRKAKRGKLYLHLFNGTS